MASERLSRSNRNPRRMTMPTLPQDLLSALAKKRLVFTVSTGRSGTDFLARVLSFLPDVDCRHEPKPRFSEYMRAAQLDPRIASRFWIQEKLPRLAKVEAPIYIETSHLFCKGFVEPLLELGVVPDLICLHRGARDVARSLYQLNHIPGRRVFASNWYLGPEDPGVLPLPGWEELHDYQLCYWYCLEIARRTEVYSAEILARGARVTQLSLLELNDPSGYGRLIEALDLPRPNWWGRFRYARARNTRTNIKASKKVRHDLPPNLEELEQEVIRRSGWEPGVARPSRALP